MIHPLGDTGPAQVLPERLVISLPLFPHAANLARTAVFAIVRVDRHHRHARPGCERQDDRRSPLVAPDLNNARAGPERPHSFVKHSRLIIGEPAVHPADPGEHIREARLATARRSLKDLRHRWNVLWRRHLLTDRAPHQYGPRGESTEHEGHVLLQRSREAASAC